MTYTIDKLQASDWERVRSIYGEGVATGIATFETGRSDWETWNRNNCGFARLVARDEQWILGWAALSPVSSRSMYVGVAEVSVYVAASAEAKGSDACYSPGSSTKLNATVSGRSRRGYFRRTPLALRCTEVVAFAKPGGVRSLANLTACGATWFYLSD